VEGEVGMVGNDVREDEWGRWGRGYMGVG